MNIEIAKRFDMWSRHLFYPRLLDDNVIAAGSGGKLVVGQYEALIAINVETNPLETLEGFLVPPVPGRVERFRFFDDLLAPLILFPDCFFKSVDYLWRQLALDPAVKKGQQFLCGIRLVSSTVR